MAELENAVTGEEPAKKGKEITYVCNTKCFFDGQIYKVGDTVTVASAVKLPPYFEKA